VAAEQLASKAVKTAQQRQKGRGTLTDKEIERHLENGSELGAFIQNVKQVASGNDGKHLRIFLNFNGGTGGYPSAKHADENKRKPGLNNGYHCDILHDDDALEILTFYYMIGEQPGGLTFRHGPETVNIPTPRGVG
jgi:hypothetical protein